MNLNQNLLYIKQLIAQKAIDCGRNPESVLLLAVSKQHGIATIQEAYQQGVRDFGESYLQEALAKITALQHLPLCWHFIGPIQSNKTKGIASHFSWVHSIERLKTAQLLNAFRPTTCAPLNVCLQINLLAEKTKAGIPCEQAKELAYAVSQLPHLKLRGLMTIPPPQKDAQSQYELFQQVHQLMNTLNQELNLSMDTLSMGMSDDFIPAIKAGATIVRIGRALLGNRK